MPEKRRTAEKVLRMAGREQSLMNSNPGGILLPFGCSASFDTTDYVVGKTLDGLFYVLGEEEKKIRTDPAAQIALLLKEVFGKQ